MRFLVLLVLFLSLPFISCIPSVPPYTAPLPQASQGSLATNTNVNEEKKTEETESDPQVQFPDSPLSAQVRDASLPYDLIPDTLTTLTCDQNVVLFGQYYSLSMGAYFDGLKLSKEFKTNNAIQDDDFSKPETAQRVRSLLDQNPLKRVVAVLGLNLASDLRSATGGGQDGGIDAQFPVLYQQKMTEQLSRDGELRFTRDISEGIFNSGLLRARLRLNGQTFMRYANNMGENGTYLLSLLYKIDNREIRVPNSNYRYGKTYKLEFNSPEVNYLRRVQEENLQTDSPGAPWVCPDDLRFMVHKYTDPSDSAFNRDIFLDERRYSRDSIAPLEELTKEGFCDTSRNRKRNNDPLLTSRQETFLQYEFGPKKNWEFDIGETVIFTTTKGRGFLSNIATDPEHPTREEKAQVFSNAYRYYTGEPCIVLRRGYCYARREGNNFANRIVFDSDKVDRGDCRRNTRNTNLRRADDWAYNLCPAYLSMCHREPED